MIFVTVGSQMPFDRLVQGVDRWAGDRQRQDVFAQIGQGGTPPRHMEWCEVLDPEGFQDRISRADVVIAHAGCGTILTALALGKPLLIMARQGSLRETRNDHQVATARRMQELYEIEVAETETELFERLDRLAARIGQGRESIKDHASEELLDAIRTFIERDR